MGPKKKTRAVSGDNFGGSAADLPESDLPTHKDITRYFYSVSLTEKDYPTQISLVVEKVTEVWRKCNPRLPLLEKTEIFRRMKRFFDKVKAYNRKHLPVSAVATLVKKIDKLFDISACRCELPIVPCSSKLVRCSVLNCQSVHIACECLPQLRVPDEEREYMRDQRSKTGTKGALQIGPVDRRTLATEKAKIARRAKQPPMRGQRHHQIVADPVNEVSYS